MWDTRRKIIYALAVSMTLSFVAVFVAYSYRDVFLPPPTCFDKKQNGFELGLDCGGACSLICSQEVKPLTVTWAKAIPAGENIYDLAAMIVNTNINNAARSTEYTFTLYDSKGNIISTFTNTLVVPIDSVFPIILQNIRLKQSPANVVVSLSDGIHVKVQESPVVPFVRVVKERYENGATPRVYATIVNTRRNEIRELPVKVVLFDVNNNAYAVGQTIVPLLGKEGAREIIVTWNEPFSAPPSKIGVYPIISPFQFGGN